MPSSLTFLAAAAERTSRIGLGTAIIILPLEDPLRVAEDAAVLDTISGGRTPALGWGTGAGRRSFAHSQGSATADRVQDGRVSATRSGSSSGKMMMAVPSRSGWCARRLRQERQRGRHPSAAVQEVVLRDPPLSYRVARPSRKVERDLVRIAGIVPEVQVGRKPSRRRWRVGWTVAAGASAAAASGRLEGCSGGRGRRGNHEHSSSVAPCEVDAVNDSPHDTYPFVRARSLASGNG